MRYAKRGSAAFLFLLLCFPPFSPTAGDLLVTGPSFQPLWSTASTTPCFRAHSLAYDSASAQVEKVGSDDRGRHPVDGFVDAIEAVSGSLCSDGVGFTGCSRGTGNDERSMLTVTVVARRRYLLTMMVGWQR